MSHSDSLSSGISTVPDSTAAAASAGKTEKAVRKPGLFITIFSIVLFCLGLLVLFAQLWALSVWAGLTMDEMVFHLTAPTTGTGGDIFRSLFLEVFLPAGIITAAAAAAAAILRKKHPAVYRRIIAGEIISSILMIVFSVMRFADRTKLSDYLQSQNSRSVFIESNYADPKTADIVFPKKKRNLIYIYLESMEMTYADQEDGGAFDENVIPELTELAQNNECFAGNSGRLNGGIVYPNCGYTMAGIFAQSSGVPLQTSLTRNNMDTQTSFFPELTTLGDILDDEGYQQTFLLGSDATFGGRRLFFQDHGDFDIRDYHWAIDTERIPSDYYVFWGYEDKKFFSYAKQTLKELASSDQPFNLTMLTVDTHFEDGYVCDLCDNRFGDNQYANVIACSSRQLYNFVSWVQKQDFYDNTTIILSGDHTTMDSDFCEDVPSDYQRKTYVCVINPAVQPEDPDLTREYSTMDLFPTTLASLGATFKGNRLGLGTNLFSAEKTLTESEGQDVMDTEMANKSEFLMDKAGVSLTDSMIDRIRHNLQPEVSRNDDGSVQIYLRGLNSDAGTVSLSCAPADSSADSSAGSTADDDVITDEMEAHNIEGTATDDAVTEFSSSFSVPSSFGNKMRFWFTIYYPDGEILTSDVYEVDLKDPENLTSLSSSSS